MKWLKENGQDEKGKLEHWKLAQKSPKLAQERSLQRKSSKTLAQASSLQGSWDFSRQTHLSK